MEPVKKRTRVFAASLALLYIIVIVTIGAETSWKFLAAAGGVSVALLYVTITGRNPFW